MRMTPRRLSSEKNDTSQTLSLKEVFSLRLFSCRRNDSHRRKHFPDQRFGHFRKTSRAIIRSLSRPMTASGCGTWNLTMKVRCDDLGGQRQGRRCSDRIIRRPAVHIPSGSDTVTKIHCRINFSNRRANGTSVFGSVSWNPNAAVSVSTM